MNEQTSASLEAIALASDVTAVRAIEYLYDQVGTLPIDDESEPDEIPKAPILQALVRSIERYDCERMNNEESIATARWLLCQLAKTSSGAETVLASLKNWDDGKQSVGVALPWTIAATLLLLVATTEIEVDSEGFRIHKKPLVPEQIEMTAEYLKNRVSVKVLNSEED